MKSGLIYFLSRPCKKLEHKLCHGYWKGFGFEYECDCVCHKEKKAADGFTGLFSTAS
jgi:hypothetical protein